MILQFVLRAIRKRPLLFGIKVLGLSLGLSGVVLISLFLNNELTYDAYHTKANRIYRFTVTDPTFFGENHFARIANSEQLPDFAAHFPEIERYVRLSPIKGGVMLYNEKYYSINEAFVCDSTFFDVFDADLLVGDKRTILNKPASMVVSASFARKVFGKVNPVGQVMSIPTGQYYSENSNFTIKGVMKDFPQKSHFHPDLITTPVNGEIRWWAYCYLELHKKAIPESITSGYAAYLAKQTDQEIESIKTKAYLQKLTDIHLRSDKLREIEENGDRTNVLVLVFAALILLLISISNFTSLNLGMSGFNQKFIAINQVHGATRHIQLKYFTIESMIIVMTSVVLSFGISIITNSIILDHFNVDLFRNNPLLILVLVVIFCALSFLAGLYPALKQNFQKRLKKSHTSLADTRSVFVSKGIIITQLTFAIILIATVIGITRQVNFALNNSLGMKQQNSICFESVHANVQEKFGVFKNELLKHASIQSVSAMLEPPGGEANDMFPFEMEGFPLNADTKNNLMGVFPCDYSFTTLFNLEFLGGGNFSSTNSDTEGSGEYILNETAMRQLNFNSPDKIIGKRFKLISPSPGITIPSGRIIGVVKDFNLSSLKKEVNPLVLFKRDKLWLLNFVVACKPGMKDVALKDVQKVWSQIYPAYPFKYEHVGALYRKVYQTELLQAKLLYIFTIISLFICSMGLLGISLLVSQQRTKEIGIRKVNGARIIEVLLLLNKRFVKWVVIAFIIATPIAWYALHKWLENFVYKTELSWWIFALSGAMALGLVLLTVSWQSLRTATRNPVYTLRSE
jgi:putative ABC transport system permease protein